MTAMEADKPWRAKWQAEAANDDHAHDFVMELRSAIDYGRVDPDVTQGYAFTAAEVAEATRDILASDMALYTPRQAAAVASALLAQLSAGAEALRNVVSAVHAMGLRGDALVPDSYLPGGPANAASALDAIDTLAERIGRLIGPAEAEAVDSVGAVQQVLNLPTDPHDTLVRVTELLGDGARLIERPHREDVHESYEEGFGCGCELEVIHDGATWLLHRGDSAWVLVAPGAEDKNGIIRQWTELSVTDQTPHPGHMAVSLRAALAKAEG